MTKTASQIRHNTLIDIVNSFAGASVLVIGDIMLDRFVYGSVDRISPESPVPVLSLEREDFMLGGTGNVAANLSALKTTPHIVSVIGADSYGQNIKDMLKTAGIIDGLVIENGRPTTIKTRYLAGHQQLLRTDAENKNPISDQTAQNIIDQAKAFLPDVEALILSDYNKGVLTPNLIKTLIALAHKHNISVIVDPKRNDMSIYQNADIITPNKKELSLATAGLPVKTNDDIAKAGHTILEQHNIGTVIATRSGDGISVITNDHPPAHIQSRNAVEVFDVSGAGDTVIAVIGACITRHVPLPDAAALADTAGRIVVSKVGTACVSANDLIHALNEDQPLPYFAVEQWSTAVEQVERWRARGLNVGFTNGCFDILHMGHVSYLDDSKRFCDRLIVGVNTDASVRILKGHSRPIHDQHARACVLKGLSSVDMVILFGADNKGEDNTASALLNILKPDTYFKGGDYTPEHIPEAPTVNQYGGHIRIMPAYEGYSTTKAIEKQR